MQIYLITVTPFQQNCSLIVCKTTRDAAVVDPGGDIERILETIKQADAQVTQILLTHGHLDLAAGAPELAAALGDVPIIGNLFKSQSRGRKKTNLMVFLRPVVMRDARQTESLTQDRYDTMRTLQQQAQPRNDDFGSRMLGINEAPVLPQNIEQGMGKGGLGALVKPAQPTSAPATAN